MIGSFIQLVTSLELCIQERLKSLLMHLRKKRVLLNLQPSIRFELLLLRIYLSKAPIYLPSKPC